MVPLLMNGTSAAELSWPVDCLSTVSIIGLTIYTRQSEAAKLVLEVIHNIYCSDIYCSDIYCSYIYCSDIYCSDIYCSDIYCRIMKRERRRGGCQIERERQTYSIWRERNRQKERKAKLDTQADIDRERKGGREVRLFC